VTILVTGGSGLVGSHVLEALRLRDVPARALVRPESRSIVETLGAEPVVGDVTDDDAWRRAARGVEAIVHAAALVATRASYDEFARVNVGGTRRAIEAARREGARLVHVSTVAVYGRTAAYRAADNGVAEDFPFQPLSAHDFYARTKRAAEELVKNEATAGGLSAVAIRPNVIYGERDRLFAPRVAKAVRRRFLPRIGSGTNHLSCVYAGNVGSAIVAALDARISRGFRAYNVTRDAEPLLTQREFLATFAEMMRVRLRFIPVPIVLARAGVTVLSAASRLIRPGRYSGFANAAVGFVVGENPYVAEQISRELGWLPPFDTRTAIARTVRGLASG
jgi:nucleoside-diphosphate-sugar epimerase